MYWGCVHMNNSVSKSISSSEALVNILYVVGKAEALCRDPACLTAACFICSVLSLPCSFASFSFFFFADKMNLVIMCSHRLIIKKDSLVISVSVSSLDCSAPVGNKRNFHTTWHSSSQTSENLWQCMSHKYTHFMRINFHFSWLGGLPGLSFSHTRFFFFFPPISLLLFLTP